MQENSKSGLVYYLSLKNIKQKFNSVPYLDLMYFSTEIMSAEANHRATSFVGNKLYGDIIFTFNGNGRLPLDLKEPFILALQNEARRNTSRLKDATDLQSVLIFIQSLFSKNVIFFL